MSEKAILVLAVALVVASLAMSFSVVTASDNLSKSIGKIQINVAAPSGGGQPAPTVLPTIVPPAPQIDAKELTKTFAGAEGSDNAPVSMVEFSDYQCLFCRRAFEDSVKQIRDNYVKAGKVKLYFKDFPLKELHPDAEAAANAARCAGEQGKYFEMHDKIFAGQGSSALGTVSIPASVYPQYASELKLDAAKFKACVDSGKYANEVNADLAQGIAVGVSGTPTFVVGGKLIVGAQPYSVLKQALDAELAKVDAAK